MDLERIDNDRVIIDNLATKTKLRPHVNLGLALFLCVVFVAVLAVHQAGEAHFDFGGYYYPARIVLDGFGHSLYDLNTQRAYQVRFHRPAILTFYYPPFALIPFLPIAELPLPFAFAVWTALSLLLLVRSVRTLAVQAHVDYENWPILLALAFMPVATNLGHGQLSLVVLSSYIFTYVLWSKGKRFSGGLALAIGALKFQLVLGFVAVLFLRRKWTELSGFAAGALLALMTSIFMVGLQSLLTYPSFVFNREGGTGSEPGNMANWRGLISLSGTHGLVLLTVLSVLTVFWAAYSWRDLDTGFSTALLAAMLVSYHFNPQDLSLSLIPFFLMIKNGILPADRVPMFALGGLLAPMVLAAMNGPYALLAIPLGAAMVIVGRRVLPNRPEFCQHT